MASANRGRSSGAEWTAWIADSLLYANSSRPRNGQASPHVASDQLRVSDAERNQVAELLSRHYSDGRLDHEELNERLQAAMSAKTRGDLKPLLADLPAAPPAPAQPASVPARRQPAKGLVALAILLVALALVLVISTGHGLPVIWLLVVAAFVMRGITRRRRRAARSFHAHLHVHGTPHWHGPDGPVVGEPPAVQPGGP